MKELNYKEDSVRSNFKEIKERLSNVIDQIDILNDEANHGANPVQGIELLNRANRIIQDVTHTSDKASYILDNISMLAFDLGKEFAENKNKLKD